MVTASHNDNGWTGVKMGANRPMTFGPDEMSRLRDIVLSASFKLRDGGAYEFVEGFRGYIADLTDRPKIKRKLKVVAACGNGTAGAFAPEVLEAVGCEVIPLDTSSITPFRATIRTPRTWRCFTPWPTRCERRARTSGSASTATATGAASSTTKARRSSPTRSE
jgi:phosphomannomutase